MNRRLFKPLTALALVLLMVVALVPTLAIGANAASVPGTFNKHTGDLVEGDYIITYGTYTLGNAVSSGRLKNGSPFTVANDAITDPSDDIVWHIAPTADGTAWTLYNAAAASYAAGTGAKNKAQLLGAATDTKAQWTVTINTDGTYDFTNVANAAAGVNKTLRQNGTYGWACYSTSTGAPVTLYKLAPAPHEHAYSWDKNVGVDGAHTLTCANTDGKCEALTTTEVCDWKDGFCTVCGAEAPECAHPATTDVPAVDPTCAEIGYTAGVQCTECNQYTSGHEEVAALGHATVTDAAVAPTCTAAGKTEGSHCSRCDEVFTEQADVEALGHNYVNGECTRCFAEQPTTLTINRDAFGDASGYAWHPWAATTTSGDGISGNGFIYGSASDSIQMNAKTATNGNYIYNTTPLPGKITSIKITAAKTTYRYFIVITSDTPFDKTTNRLTAPDGSSSLYVDATGATWTFTTDCKYFAVIAPDTGAAYLSSIEIAYEKEDQVGGYTVTLGDNIGVNFYMDLTKATLADETAYMLFTLPNGTTEKVYVKDIKNDSLFEYNGKTLYRFTAYIAAKEMADEIKAQLFTAAGDTKEYTYRVQTYADAVIKGDYTATEKALAKALLNYGAYAQLMFGYNTDALVNDVLETADKELADVTIDASYQKNYTANISGVTFLGTTTMWEADTSIRHYFEITDAANVTFKLCTADGTPIMDLEVHTGAYGEYVAIDGIVAKDMATTYKLVISNGAETQTITYSVYSYFYDILASDRYSETEKTAVKAAYLYSQAAIAYLN